MNILHTAGHYEVDNFHQRARAAGIVFRVAEQACRGNLGVALMTAEKPYDWHPQGDGRSAVMKRYRAAEDAMYKAIEEYDVARAAAHEALKVRPA